MNISKAFATSLRLDFLKAEISFDEKPLLGPPNPITIATAGKGLKLLPELLEIISDAITNNA